jgi:hypothetical protein
VETPPVAAERPKTTTDRAGAGFVAPFAREVHRDRRRARTMRAMLLVPFAALVLLLQSAPPAAEPPVAPSAEPKPSETTPKPTETTPKPTETTPPAATPPAATPERVPSASDLPPEEYTRAYIVVDRVSTAAGTIESDDESVIVLRDEKGRVRSFTKNRVLAIKYLLDGPSGRRVRVIFNDGRVLVGNLVEDGYEAVLLEVQGISTKYPREAVGEVLPYPTDQELYERFRTTVEPDQFGARYTLALWLYQKKMYLESKRELESLLEATNHYEAKQLLNEVSAQLKLMSPTDGAGDGASTRGGGEDRTKRTKDDPKTPLLSAAEVNLIRVYEIDLNDPPRIQIPESLIATMLERYSESELIPAKSTDRKSFYAKEPIDIVKTLFALKARDLYGEIEVLGEPESLNLFRQRVHNAWLINNCATSRCHGGPDGGRLYFHNKNFKDDETRMTNLLILTRTTLDGLPLIDFEKPTDSLLFQYALPKTEARRPHPDVRGWSPVFTPGRRGLQEDFVDWVRSMKIQRGEYPGIEYTPPGLKRPERQAPSGPDR